MLINLCKIFDTINHDLLPMNCLSVFDQFVALALKRLNNDSLKLLYSYLNNRSHSTKINWKFSSRRGLSQEVPQGCLLGPISSFHFKQIVLSI